MSIKYLSPKQGGDHRQAVWQAIQIRLIKQTTEQTTEQQQLIKQTTTKWAKKAPKKQATKGEYKVVVETGGKVYEAQTDDISEALLGFGIKYTNTKIVFKVTKGKKTRQVTHFRAQGLRILKNGMASRFFARNTEKFLA